MSHTNIDIDEQACAEVMRRFGFTTKKDAVNFALRKLATEPLSLEEALKLCGSDWEGDLDEMRSHGPARSVLIDSLAWTKLLGGSMSRSACEPLRVGAPA